MAFCSHVNTQNEFCNNLEKKVLFLQILAINTCVCKSGGFGQGPSGRIWRDAQSTWEEPAYTAVMHSSVSSTLQQCALCTVHWVQCTVCSSELPCSAVCSSVLNSTLQLSTLVQHTVKQNIAMALHSSFHCFCFCNGMMCTTEIFSYSTVVRYTV